MNFRKRSILLSFATFSLVMALLGSNGAAQVDTTEAALLIVHGGSEKQAFNLSDLDALPQHRFITSTIWTTEPTEFSGPALADVIASSGLSVEVLKLRAANDYTITLKSSMLEENAPIVATRINGKTFSLRERGPLWLVFPYDAHARYRSEHIFAVSIWQLTDILADHPQ